MQGNLADSMQLGVLDHCFLQPGQRASDRLSETVELAKHADRIGLSRYWLSEHHGPGNAHACPEIVASGLLQATKRIRIGSAGVLLRFTSPLKVAEVFCALEALAPRRVDLGIGRGGAGPDVVQALLDGRLDDPAAYDRRVMEIAALVRGDPNSPVKAWPNNPTKPQLWVLGSGLGSAPLAGRLGAGFSYGQFLKGADLAGPALELFRKRYRSSAQADGPIANIAVAGICHENSSVVDRLRKEHTNEFIRPTVVGSPAQCAEELFRLKTALGVEEVIFAQLGGTLEQKLSAYTQLHAHLRDLETELAVV